MKKTNLHEAKTNLSKLIELVAKGEEVIICRAGEPVAKLISYKAPKKARKSGAWAGKGTVEKDFDKLPSDFMKYFK